MLMHPVSPISSSASFCVCLESQARTTRLSGLHSHGQSSYGEALDGAGGGGGVPPWPAAASTLPWRAPQRSVGSHNLKHPAPLRAPEPVACTVHTNGRIQRLCGRQSSPPAHTT